MPNSEHRRLGRPGRFTPADMARYVGMNEHRAAQFFRGYHGALPDVGEIPSQADIAKVATAYRISPQTLRDRLLEDAGRLETDELTQLEVCANTIIRYVRAVQARQEPPG